MTRSLLLTIVLSALSILMYAQGYSDEPKVFTGGLILGANISKIDDVDDFSHYHKVGLNVGGIVTVHFTQAFGVSMELLYSQKGDHEVDQSTSYALGSYFSEYFARLNYIEVPIMLHYTQNKMDYEIGASYSRLISSYESISIDQPVYIDPLYNYFNKEDYNFIIGGSYNFYKHYYFNVRWQFSVVPIRDGNRLPTTYWFDGQQNNAFNFRLIYMF